jgi:hypothetical protein
MHRGLIGERPGDDRLRALAIRMAALLAPYTANAGVPGIIIKSALMSGSIARLEQWPSLRRTDLSPDPNPDRTNGTAIDSAGALGDG